MPASDRDRRPGGAGRLLVVVFQQFQLTVCAIIARRLATSPTPQASE